MPNICEASAVQTAVYLFTVMMSHVLVLELDGSEEYKD